MGMDNTIENKYFPELDNLITLTKPSSKYGILNVGLNKNNNVISGYQWNYSYWDGEKIRYIHSYDLRKLRQRVLDIGKEWIIIDNSKAIDSYKLNNELVEKHDKYLENKDNCKYRGISGVAYVTIQKDNRTKNKKRYWKYSHNGLNICDTDLKSLKSKVINKGGNWMIRDKRLYEKNIKEGVCK